MIKTGTKIQGVDTESKLQIDVLDLAEKLQLLPKDEALRVFYAVFQCGRKRSEICRGESHGKGVPKNSF